MRSLTVDALEEIAKPQGTEPVTLVSISWYDDIDGNGVWFNYADDDIWDNDTLLYSGKMLSLSNLNTVMKLNSSGISGEVQMTIDDSLGEIRTFFDNYDIHRRQCKIYQWFNGLAIEDAFLVFWGEISSQIDWSEGQRTVSFSVLPINEVAEVGFTIDEGDGVYVAPEARGKVWPIAFGNPINVPCVKIGDELRAISLAEYKPITIMDVDKLFQPEVAFSGTQSVKARAAALGANVWFVDNWTDYTFTGTIWDTFEVVGELEFAQWDFKKFAAAIRKIRAKATGPHNKQPTLQDEYDQILIAKDNALVRAWEDLESLWFGSPSQESTVVLFADVTANFIQNQLDVNTAERELSAFLTSMEGLIVKRTAIQAQIDALPAGAAARVPLLAQRLTIEFAIIKLRDTTLLAATTRLNRTSALLRSSYTNYLAGRDSLVQFVLTAFRVSDSERFAQDTELIILLNGVKFRGYFNNEIFHINGTVLPTENQLALARYRQSTRPDQFWLAGIDPNPDPDSDSDSDLDPDPETIEYANLVNHYCMFETSFIYNIHFETWKRSEDPTFEDTRVWFNADAETNSVSKYQLCLVTNQEGACCTFKNPLYSAQLSIAMSGNNRHDDTWHSFIYNIGLEETIIETLEHKWDSSKRPDPDEQAEGYTPPDPFYLYYRKTVITLKTESKIVRASPYINNEWVTTLEASDTRAHINGLNSLTANNWSFQQGDEIRAWPSLGETYVASFIPASTVLAVNAFRSIDGVKRLVAVPSSYYTVNNAYLIFGRVITTIFFKKPLSDYDQDWDNQIYASIQSAIGSNTLDQLNYLIDGWTYFSIDFTSFNSVRTAIANYPSNFAITTRKDVLTYIKEISWQARVLVWVDNAVAYFKYLPEEQDEVKTVGQSDIVPDSLHMTFTSTERLVTRFNANWKRSGVQEKPFTVVIRTNEVRYGSLAQDYDFYIYNIWDMVWKSATFWAIRNANTWKILKFKVYLNQLDLESFDTILVDYDGTPVKGLIQDVSYDSSQNNLDMEVWLPIRMGESEQYIFAWPAGLGAGVPYNGSS